MELGRREVGDVVVDGDLDDALDGHDGGGADVVRRRGDGARVPVPLRVLLHPRAHERGIALRHLRRQKQEEKKNHRRGEAGKELTVRCAGTRSEQTARPRSARDTRTPESGSALKARSGPPSTVAPASSSHLRAPSAIHAGGSRMVGFVGGGLSPDDEATCLCLV